MKRIACLLALLLIFPAMAIAGNGNSVPIDMQLAGTVISVSETAQIYDVNLKGSPGRARAQGAGWGAALVFSLDDLPAGHVCDAAPAPGIPVGLIITDASATMTFEDLSMLFLNVAEGSYVCLWTPFVRGAYEIAGGAGRFQDATGWVAMEFNLYRSAFPSDSLVGAETGIAYGEIILP